MPRLALASPASPTPIPLLRTISLFRTLDDRSLGALAMHARLYTLPHGSFLDGSGADHEPLYVVAQGQLALYHRDGEERDVIVDVLQQDDLLGWLPFEAKALGQEAILYCLSRPHVDRIAAGLGWQTSFTPHIDGDSTGTLVFQDGSGATWPFTYVATRVGTLQYRTPLGLPWQLTVTTALTTAYTLTNILSGDALVFDAQGHLHAETDSYGNSNTLAPGDQPDSETNSGGRRLQFSYDTDTGLLTEAASPLWQSGQPDGQHVRYSYDDGRLTALTWGADSPQSQTAVFGYDGTDLITVTTPAGRVWTLHYNSDHQVDEITAARSAGSETPDADTAIAYADRATTVTDGYGSDHAVTTRYDLDDAGQATAITDGDADTTRYTYDDRHDVSTITDARGNTTTYEYQDAGPNGSTGLLTSVEQPAIGSDLHPVTTTYSYDPATYDLIERDRDRGGRTLYRYDGDHHAVLATATLLDGSANTWTGSVNTYDSYGELLSTADGRGLMPSNDPAMPVTVDATHASAYTRSWTYTDEGDVATASTAPITTTAHGTTQANTPVVTRFSYDDDGNLRAATSPNGETTTYDYDGLGRPTQTQYPAVPVDGATQTPVDTTQYDGDGNVTRQSDALNHATSYDYDALGRPIAIANPLGASTVLTYTATHLAQIRDSRGNVTSYTYDAADRLTKVTDAMGTATTYDYDADGNLTGLTRPLDTSGAATVEQRVYDALNEVVSDTVGGSGEDTPTPSQTSTFGYDHDGHLVRQQAPNGDETGASFDLAGRPITQALYPSADTPSVAQQTLSFDAAGNPVDVVDYMGRDHRRTFDGNNRLTQEIDCSGPCPDVNGVVTTLESDPDGNTLTVTQAVPVATTTPTAMSAATLSPSLTASRTNSTGGPGSSAAPANRQAQQAHPKVFHWTLPAGPTRPERSPTTTATRLTGAVHAATMKQQPALSRPALVLSDRILVHGAPAMVRAAALTAAASDPTGARTAGPAPTLGHPIPPAFRRSMVRRGPSPEAAPTSGVLPTNSTSPGRSAPATRA